MNRKASLKIQTTTCKRAACGLAVPPYHRAKPINLPSNAAVASRGRPPAFFETLARPSTLTTTTSVLLLLLLELELKLIQTQMAQEPMLRAEVGMRVRCANKASAE